MTSLLPVDPDEGAHLATCAVCSADLIVTEPGVLYHHGDGSHTFATLDDLP